MRPQQCIRVIPDVMGLLHMGKLVENDKLALQDWKKLL